METILDDDWFNPIRVEERYKISKSTLAKWRMKKINLPFSKVGKYIKYRKTDIEAFLTANIVNVEVA